MVFRSEGILALFFGVEGILSSNRGQDAHDTQGRDALATKNAGIVKAEALGDATRYFYLPAIGGVLSAKCQPAGIGSACPAD